MIAIVRSALPYRPGVTVVIVSWNSGELLSTTVRAVRQFSPEARLVVVDNGSEEKPRIQNARVIRLDRNLGHGPALDIGFFAARTRFVVALDVDAFPIADSWLEQLTEPLRSGEANVSGAHGGEVIDRWAEDRNQAWKGRDFVHPCCLAMELRRFVRAGHSFRKAQIGDRLADPGEEICRRENGRLHYLEPTSVRGPSVLGTVFGDVVYHNFYGTRHRKEGSERLDGVTADDAMAAWNAAVDRYLA